MLKLIKSRWSHPTNCASQPDCLEVLASLRGGWAIGLRWICSGLSCWEVTEIFGNCKYTILIYSLYCKYEVNTNSLNSLKVTHDSARKRRQRSDALSVIQEPSTTMGNTNVMPQTIEANLDCDCGTKWLISENGLWSYPSFIFIHHSATA